MSEAKIESLGQGLFSVGGVLDATTVTAILKRSRALFADSAVISLDLAGVTEGDSAGLALLIEWLRLAQQKRQKISFVNVPQQIEALARISEVEDLFHANGSSLASQTAAAAQ